MRADLRGTYDDLLAFLKLPPFPEVSLRPMNDNKTIRSRFVARLTERNAGVRYTRKLQFVKKAVRLANVSLRAKLRKLNQVRGKRGEMRPEFRCMLQNEFRDDIQLLAQLTHRNLDHWLA